MELFKKAPHIDFLGRRRVAYVFSALLLLVSIGSLATRGLNFGIVFTGGTLVELGYSAGPSTRPDTAAPRCSTSAPRATC